jgi:hypothetical protein
MSSKVQWGEFGEPARLAGGARKSRSGRKASPAQGRKRRRELAAATRKLQEARLQARLRVLDYDDDEDDERVLRRLLRNGGGKARSRGRKNRHPLEDAWDRYADYENCGDEYDAGFVDGFDDADDQYEDRIRSRNFYGRLGYFMEDDGCCEKRDPCKRPCPSPADLLKQRLLCSAGPEVLYGSDGMKYGTLCAGSKNKKKKKSAKKKKKKSAAAAKKRASPKKKPKSKAKKQRSKKRASPKKQRPKKPKKKKGSQARRHSRGRRSPKARK